MGEESVQTKLLEWGSCGNIPNKGKQESNCNIKNRWLPACKFFADLVDWSVVSVCCLPPPDFEFVPTGNSQGSVILRPHFKSICLYVCLWASNLFTLTLSAYQRPIPYTSFHSYVSKENWLNIEGTSEDPGAEMLPVHNTMHLDDVGVHRQRSMKVIWRK